MKKLKLNIISISQIAVFAALYVVFSITMKIPLGVGSITVDLGYIVLTVSAFLFGMKAGIIGGLGAFLESLLFSQYGVSYGWILMNLFIGIVCGCMFKNMDELNGIDWLKYAYLIVCSVFVGVAIKTVVECLLYSIPLAVKAPKSLAAFAVDSVVMIVGIPIAAKVKKVARQRRLIP